MPAQARFCCRHAGGRLDQGLEIQPHRCAAVEVTQARYTPQQRTHKVLKGHLGTHCSVTADPRRCPELYLDSLPSLGGLPGCKRRSRHPLTGFVQHSLGCGVDKAAAVEVFSLKLSDLILAIAGTEPDSA